MNLLARILSHGFALALVVLIAIALMYRGELFPEWDLPEFLVIDNNSGAAEAVAEEPEVVIEVFEAVPEEPEVVIDMPEAVPEESEVVIEVPEAALEEPEVVIEVPEAAIEEPEVVIDMPEAALEEPEVVIDIPEAALEEPEIVIDIPEAVPEEPEVLIDMPEPVVTDEPAAAPEPAQASDPMPEPVVLDESATARDSSQEKTAYVLLAQAREAYWLRDYENAEKTYRQLIELEPNNPDGYGELGNLYFAQGQWDQAAAAYYDAGVRMLNEGMVVQARQLVDVIRGLNGTQADELEQQVNAASQNTP